MFLIGLCKNAVWLRLYLLFGHLFQNIVDVSKKRQLRPYEIVDVRESCKMPESFEKSPISGAEKHPDFQVTT